MKPTKEQSRYLLGVSCELTCMNCRSKKDSMDKLRVKRNIWRIFIRAIGLDVPQRIKDDYLTDLQSTSNKNLPLF